MPCFPIDAETGIFQSIESATRVEDLSRSLCDHTVWTHRDRFCS